MMQHQPRGRGSERMALRLLRPLLPHAERAEVLGDLAQEHARRRDRDGRARAGLWLWRQVVLSVPALVGRTVWRGRTGFEPESNRMRTGGPMLETWIMDARHAVRRLVKRPTYALLATLTLALGVGGTAATFGIARELLLSPLPMAAEEDVHVWWMTRSWNEAEFLHLQATGTPGFERIAAYGLLDVRLGGDDGTRVLPAVRTAGGLFELLGARPLLGPGLSDADDVQGSELKVVLSHGLWRDLGADPSLVGRTLEVEGFQRTVAGVMPPGFWFPDPSVRLWLSRNFDPEARSGWYSIIGRTPRGQSPAELEHGLQQIAASLGAQFTYPPQWDPTLDPRLTPVREHILGPSRPTLVATLAAMAVILLMACANVAALMLGQTETRGTELSVRSALGAGRGRLTQQLIAEGVILGMAAGVLGAAVAAAAFRILLAALPLGALAERATLDWSIFAVSLLLALVAALLIAMIPVLSVLRSDLRGGLAAGRTAGIAGRGGRLENGLVIAEVALAVVVAAGAVLLMRSVGNLRELETGLNTDNVAVVDIVVPNQLPMEGRWQVLQELLRGVQATPGVQRVAAVQRLPLRGGGDNWGLTVEGRPDIAGVTTSFRIVTHDYFDVMGARLVAGRLFAATDNAAAEPVMVINESLARQFFPDGDALGRRIEVIDDHARVVGIIADVQEQGLTDDPAPARYVLYDQTPYMPAGNSLVLRTAPGADAMTVAASSRQVVQRAHGAVGIQNVTTMSRVFDLAVGPARQMLTLLGVLAGLALLLGGIGVYGVVSHFVHRRRREWGIRLALGLRPIQVVRHVTGKGAILVAAGTGIGVVAARVVSDVLAAFVYGLGTADPGSYAVASLLLLSIGLLGALIPALRASRVDPARVLREE
jgi:putative ABC transport system permease protein